MRTPRTPARSCGCRFRAEAPRHHDRLLDLERADFAEMAALVEGAVLWGEVDVDDTVIEPSDWVEFVEAHTWREPERVLDFVLALQSIVGRTPTELLRSSERHATVHHLHVVPDPDEAVTARSGALG